MTSFCVFGFIYLKRRLFLVLWISLVLYLFYDTFIYYKNAPQFFYLRKLLGSGLCLSRGTAVVLNLCCALILLPLCKKLNHVLCRLLGTCWPRLFFFWLESAKSFHMTVAVTLLVFAVIHSGSHLVNLWNFSRGYDAELGAVNFAAYRNENPIRLLASHAGLTGMAMLAIVLTMGATSLRVVRRKIYHAFWYTHQLYLPLVVLLVVHPLSGALKEEVLHEAETSHYASQIGNSTNNTKQDIKFISIKSKTWLWISLPLLNFFLDLIWRIFARNRARVDILEVTHMAGRTLSLTLSIPYDDFRSKMGQYVLLQCSNISLLEWHPITVVRVPTRSERNFVVWIRIKGDWTEALESMLIERGLNMTSLLVDGPFSSPMEGASRNEVSICVAAGVGITPFVSLLHELLRNPRGRSPGRVHLLWIVRHEREITWLADLATKCIQQLRNSNRPDRLHLEFHVTSKRSLKLDNKETGALTHMVVLGEKGDITHSILKGDRGEKESLLTPKLKRSAQVESGRSSGKEFDADDDNYEIAKEYPILGCRVRRGRPHWDRVFGYWVHLYPRSHLNLYCCGPKKLVTLLKNKCSYASVTTKTKFTFIHEGF